MFEAGAQDQGLRIARDVLASVQVHAVQGYPHEVVGVLAGDRSTRTVTRIQPLTNVLVHGSERHHRTDAAQVVHVETALSAEGLDVLGHYHSHPDHPACPSEHDRCRAWPTLVYVIVSVGPTGLVDTRAWQLAHDRRTMLPVPLTLASVAPDAIA